MEWGILNQYLTACTERTRRGVWTVLCRCKWIIKTREEERRGNYTQRPSLGTGTAQSVKKRALPHIWPRFFSFYALPCHSTLPKQRHRSVLDHPCLIHGAIVIFLPSIFIGRLCLQGCRIRSPCPSFSRRRRRITIPPRPQASPPACRAVGTRSMFWKR